MAVHDSVVSSWLRGEQPPPDHEVSVSIVVRIDDDRGVQGLSILFASGDQGVCGREGCGLLKKVFHPDFPAASPYITAVGGTDFLGSGVGDEKAWQAGGGGFSNTFDIPAYQREGVAAYKARPDANLCSFFFNLGSHVVDFGYYFSHCYLFF